VLAAGALILVALVAGLSVLRPSEGEAADSQATTEAVPEATAPETITDDGSTSDVTSEFQPQFGGIVRIDGGFLGLGWPNKETVLPQLFGSEGGNSWTAIEAIVPRVPAVPDTQVDFSNLIRVDEGFALLRSRQTPSETGVNIVTDRLISSDGILWAVDGGFVPVVTTSAGPFGSLPFPVFHTADGFGLEVSSDTPGAFDGLFSQVVADTSDINPTGICFVQPASTLELETSQLEVFGCDPDNQRGQSLTAADLINPNAFDAVAACVETLQSSGVTNESTLHIRRTAQGAASLENSEAFLYTPLPDGQIAALSVGDLFLEDSGACDSFSGALPEIQAAAIVLLAPNNTINRIPLPPDITSVGAMHGTDNAVMILLNDSVWRLDFATQTWRNLLDLPDFSDDTLWFDFVDSERLFGIGNDEIVHINIASGETISTPVESGDFPQVIFTDSEVAIVRGLDGDDELSVIDLPQ